MAYIGKDDLKFVTFANRKYKKFKVDFQYYDDYILWLYYDYFGANERLYLVQLEEDLKEYSDLQTGSNRHDMDKVIYETKQH